MRTSYRQKILPSSQSQIIEKDRFTYSLFKKAFEKQTKTMEDQGREQGEVLLTLKPSQQLKSIEYLFPKTIGPINEIKKIKR